MTATRSAERTAAPVPDAPSGTNTSAGVSPAPDAGADAKHARDARHQRQPGAAVPASLRRRFVLASGIVVIGSVAALLLLLASWRAENSAAVPDVERTTISVERTRSDADPVRAPRSLPTGDLGDLELQSVTWSPASRPVAAFVRSDDDRVTAVVVLEADGPPVPIGLGVGEGRLAPIGSTTGRLLPNGAADQHLLVWRHLDLGSVQAWANGVSPADLLELATAINSADAPDEAELPEGWRVDLRPARVEASGVWRASWSGTSGAALTILSSEAPTSEPGPCSGPAEACDAVVNVSARNGATTTVIGPPDRAGDTAGSLRQVDSDTSLIRRFEQQPWSPAPVARSMAMLPGADSDWTATRIATHWSAEVLRPPDLVLVTREVPQIGRLTGVVAIELLTGREIGLAGVEPGPGVTQVEVDRPDGVLRLRGWKHSVAELELLASTVLVDNEGMGFASRAVTPIGLERNYEVAQSNPLGRSRVEGPVFWASVGREDGATAEVRISATMEHLPALDVFGEMQQPGSVEVEVNGLPGSIRRSLDGFELAWSPVPGRLVVVTGPDRSSLIDLGRDLEIAGPAELRVATAADSDGS